jgi:hypothetical protein
MQKQQNIESLSVLPIQNVNEASFPRETGDNDCIKILSIRGNVSNEDMQKLWAEYLLVNKKAKELFHLGNV